MCEDGEFCLAEFNCGVYETLRVSEFEDATGSIEDLINWLKCN